MTPPFDLHFRAAPPAQAIGLPPPPITLSPPDYGWLRWRFGEGDAVTTVQLSNLYPGLINTWVWAEAIAHQLLPVTLRIDEEGKQTDLVADWSGESEDSLLLAMVQFDVYGHEYRRLAWREDRTNWLVRLGDCFASRLDADFDLTAWINGDDWPEPACHLPWRWPARVAPHTASDWPPHLLRAWFFLMLTVQFDVHVPVRTAAEREYAAKLDSMFVRQKLAALDAAWRTLRDGPFPDTADLSVHQREASDLFEEIDFMHEGGEVDPCLLDEAVREQRLRHTVHSLQVRLHRLCRHVMGELQPRFPLRKGQWLMDEYLRPGRIAQAPDSRMVVDWGEHGVSSEVLFHQGFRATWRWPITAPPADTLAEFEVHRRWARFAASTQTAHLTICPCCGYPDQETDPDEIMNCHVCGWPLYRVLRYPLPDPHAPIFDTISGDYEAWPTLAESRQFFLDHGDAYPAEDREHTRKLRSEEVAILRRRVIADFEDWLADSGRNEQPLPDDNWLRLAGYRIAR